MEEKKFLCEWNQCYKKFRQSSHLISHKNSVHLKIKIFYSYICSFNECKKSFPKSSELKDEMKRHLSIKKYKCHYYEYDTSFVTSKELNRHIIRKHSLKWILTKINNILISLDMKLIQQFFNFIIF